MYAVIFRAEVREFDPEYFAMAESMRNLAMDQYGCLEFVASTEGHTEIAISYWDNETQIKAWKQDSQHLLAQAKGRSKWYTSYKVQVVEVVREYGG